MHAFGLTDRFAVLNEGAFVVDPLRLLLSGRPFIENFRWEPERGSRLWVVDRRARRVVGSWETAPHFCFHHVNAFEDGDRLVVDLLAHGDAEVVGALGLQRLRAGDATPWPTLTRYELDLTRPGSRAQERALTSVPFELPRIAYRAQNGRPYRVAWGAGPSDGAGWFDQVVRVDIATGEHIAWHEPGSFPGEPVHVARPGATEEEDGVLLSVVLEPARGSSALVVLDARTLEPLARARMAHHVPFGFHGQYTQG
jgi:carotenoid cleavage dioxygenase-like enzyme